MGQLPRLEQGAAVSPHPEQDLVPGEAGQQHDHRRGLLRPFRVEQADGVENFLLTGWGKPGEDRQPDARLVAEDRSVGDQT